MMGQSDDSGRQMKSHYKKVFSIKWGEEWYASVVEPLVLSAEKNERLREEREAEVPIPADEDWQPYELIIETQVGLVLVLCQTYITNVVSQVANLHNDFPCLLKEGSADYITSKRDLLQSYSRKYDETNLTQVAAIDYLANYFKHHEEWKGKPELLSGNAKRTADAVQKMGCDVKLNLWLSRNLSRAVKPLGVDDLHRLPELLTIVDEWKHEIGRTYQERGVFDV